MAQGSKKGKEDRNDIDRGLPSFLDDCDRPACHDTLSSIQAAFKGATSKNAQMVASNKFNKRENCPPNSAQLGRGSWDLLHSMAAWYPDTPTSDDQTSMLQFINSFAKFYPCTYCAEDFRRNLERMPPKVKSREDLCVWMCRQHNVVNKKLGKPAFPCNMEDLDRRWRKGVDQCWE
mmetsp:Transcript_14620/g.22575  ORF Transcript_14620/g.22575 Transcript_14620/m.22575 type:complete len:176 (+) Transcript_14620:77-604(+)|eukprot:CAMPEP_0196811086 /NCGR_PEP_ID=MMETSP1362-20130617/16945_1 /TAXON_ID=163516 /ORGANISM="Leptocylindrus danicus, Strain CCMP1856" /LENGTH=175 /DNA_ID=CAMNT_0042186337 /DNA_START=46 /DNA_END=573 /DNA_ORIENTATION=-